MAKGNMFLGMSRGSVGDVTFYRGYGQQIARARNRNPKNPKTTAQTIQRMILATASRAYSRMKGITDHSFQGVSYGGRSQQYFLKRAMEDIRNWVAQTIDITGEFPAALRDPRLYVGLATPNSAYEAGVGLLISDGTIPSVQAVLNTPAEGEDAKVDHFGALMNVGEEDIPSVANVMAALGAVVGDQVTICELVGNGQFEVSRYVIKADATAAELAQSWEEDGSSAAFDEQKTIVGDAVISRDNTRVFAGNQSNDEIIAAAIIISRKVGDVWQRSTQRLVWMQDAGDYTYTESIAAQWLAGTTPIDAENPYYLNQADE